ncbi:hypothetical protein F5B19DRAFT_466462, partial [Rostrohypoxylon terebratum]
MSFSGSPSVSFVGLSGSDSISWVHQGSPMPRERDNALRYLHDKEDPFQTVFLKDTRYKEIQDVFRHVDHSLGDAAGGSGLGSKPTSTSSAKSASQSLSGRTYQDLVANPDEFAYHWEKKAVPYLKQTMLKELDVLSVAVARSVSGERRDVVFLSRSKLTDSRKNELQSEIKEAFPKQFRCTLDFHFSPGEITPAMEKRDNVCTRKNPWQHTKPMMGDSAGVGSEWNGGTLGPVLDIGGKPYWLVNCHILADTIKRLQLTEVKRCENVELYQPSLQDHVEVFSSFKTPGLNLLGTLTSWSGEPFKTTRKSLFTFVTGGDPHHVVTDWAIFEASINLRNNQMRVPNVETNDENYVRSGSRPRGKEEVKVSGRTSGFTKAFISEVPSVVLSGRWNRVPHGENFIWKSGNSTRLVTREWTLYHGLTPYGPFVTDGAGIPGDSGASVVDANNNEFYGLVWGRNEYSDTYLVDEKDIALDRYHIPRLTYFTPYDDICDDIQEKMKSSQRPKLPDIAGPSRLPLPQPPQRSSAATQPSQRFRETIRMILSIAVPQASSTPHSPKALPVRVISGTVDM